MPHAVMDGQAFQGTGHTARSLLFELIRQLSGSNNGHLQLALGWLKKRGWHSADVVQRAKGELLERELIVQTRQGGLNYGPSLYAVTWLPISNFVGLDMSQQTFRQGAWALADKLPFASKHNGSSVSRSSAVPFDGVVRAVPVPADGANSVPSGTSAVPSHGNNVFSHTRGAVSDGVVVARERSRKLPVEGKAGRSGKRATP